MTDIFPGCKIASCSAKCLEIAIKLDMDCWYFFMKRNTFYKFQAFYDLILFFALFLNIPVLLSNQWFGIPPPLSRVDRKFVDTIRISNCVSDIHSYFFSMPCASTRPFTPSLTDPFTIFRAPRSGDRRILNISETSCDGFWINKIVKGLVGRVLRFASGDGSFFFIFSPTDSLHCLRVCALSS